MFPFGLLLVDPWFLNPLVSGFFWFADPPSAINFLRSDLWELIASAGRAVSSQTRDLYEEALADRSGFASAWVDKLSSDQDELLIVWFGDFESLLAQADPITRGIAKDFRDESGLSETDPLDLQAYKAFLGRYLR